MIKRNSGRVLLGVFLATLLMAVSLAGACAKPASPTPAPKSAPATSAAPPPSVSPTAAKHPIVTIDVLTATTGTAAYILGFELGRLMEKYHPWLRVSAAETAGAIFNTKAVVGEPPRQPKTIFLGGPTTNEVVKAEDPARWKGVNDLTLVMTYANLGPFFFETFDAKIKTPQDLVGKRIGLGTRAQNLWSGLPAAQLKAWGILDKVTLNYLGTGPAVNALVDGAMDACMAAPYTGIGKEAKTSLTEPLSTALATNKTLYYVGAATKQEAEKALESKTWAVGSLPAGSIKFQDKEIWGLVAPVTLAAHKSVPDEVVYEFTKFVLERYKELLSAHVTFGSITPATLAFETVNNNIHPGALKAYQDYAKANPDSEAAKYYKEWGVIK